MKSTQTENPDFKSLRQKAGMTLKALAEKTRYSVAAINGLENKGAGSSRLRDSVLEALKPLVPLDLVHDVSEEKPATQIERIPAGHFPTFAGRLKWLREERLKIPLRTFAESVNASKTYIYNLETGKRDNPSVNLLESICAKYKVRMDWLKNGYGVPTALQASAGGQSVQLSGPEAPLAVFLEGEDSMAIMRIMISQMDNRELIEKSYAVLASDDFTLEQKLDVIRLYVSALYERINRRAPSDDLDLADAALAKEEAAATKSLAGETRRMREEEAGLQDQHDLHQAVLDGTIPPPPTNVLMEEAAHAFSMLVTGISKLAKDPSSGVKMRMMDGGKMQIEFPERDDFRAPGIAPESGESDVV